MNTVTIELQNPTRLVRAAISNILREGPYVHAYARAWCISKDKAVLGNYEPNTVFIRYQNTEDEIKLTLYLDRVKLLKDLNEEDFDFSSLRQTTDNCGLLQKTFDALISLLEAAYLGESTEQKVENLKDCLTQLNDLYQANLIYYATTIQNMLPYVKEIQRLEYKLREFEEFNEKDLLDTLHELIPELHHYQVNIERKGVRDD